MCILRSCRRLMNVIPKCVPPKILHQRINHFTVNGQSQGAILEQYNKKMKKVAFSESEDSFAFSFASDGLDQLTKMRKKLFDVLGSSIIRIAGYGLRSRYRFCR